MSQPVQGGPPPWFRPDIQQQVAWRDGDIVISVPVKSGTTWTMNIVYQLIAGPDPEFEDIYAEVPWIELLHRPGQSPQELLDRIAAMSPDRPRAFKSHSAPPTLPYHAPGSAERLRYVVVCRNPEEALVSMRPFLARHTEAWYSLWGLSRPAVLRPDFPTFYTEVVDPAGMQEMLFAFLAAWWPLRGNDNVLMMHYADMKKDHEGSIGKIADFLGIKPGPDEWKGILEYTSFPWMKAHQTKFEATTVADIPILEPGAMIRTGQLGRAGDDGMNEAISKHLRAIGRRICPDEAALEWFYRGGPVPD